MKFGSIEQIVHEADKAMLKAAHQLSTVKLVDGDEELFALPEDGFCLNCDGGYVSVLQFRKMQMRTSMVAEQPRYPLKRAASAFVDCFFR